LAGIRKRYANYPADKLNVGAVVVDSAGNALGYLQMALHGMPVYPEGLHTTKPGEAYIETIGVGPNARGKGVGTTLLVWAEATAKERGCTVLGLGVVNGNPASRLYDRFGFVAEEVDCCDSLCGAGIVFCLLGRPYGCCAQWGSTDMYKKL
jgi:ribosomal protein S18 acetylase RimI-like enzyme